MLVDDTAGNGPGRYCSPRHRMPFNSRDQGSLHVWLMLRAIPARSYLLGVALLSLPLSRAVVSGGAKGAAAEAPPGQWLASRKNNRSKQGLTLVHCSAQPKPFWSTSHLPVSRCLIDLGKIMHPTYPTKCAYFEPKSGRV